MYSKLTITVLAAFTWILQSNAQVSQDLDAELDASSDQHMREELGVNPITAPEIRDLLKELDLFRPIPIDLISTNKRDAVFSNRMQTAMHFGSLVADGFMLTLAERPKDLEDVGRALIRQATNLGVGDRLTRRSKSLLEKSGRGDWIGMRQELVETQDDVEETMMQLRDEEIAHMISLGGWLRGFQLATHSAASNYFPTRAAGLVRVEVIEYFIDRLDTLHPRTKSTELVASLAGKLAALRAMSADLGERPPTKEEVVAMRDLADEIFLLTVSPVNDEGKIVGPPQILTSQ